MVMIQGLNFKSLVTKSKVLVFSDQAFVSISNFLLAVLITRYYGIHVFGAYTVLVSFVAFGRTTNEALTIKPLVTLYPSSRNKERYLKNSFILQLLVSSFLCFVFCVFGYVYNVFWNNNFSYILLAMIVLTLTLTDFIRRSFYLCRMYINVLFLDILIWGGQLFCLLMLKGVCLDSLESLLTIIIVFNGIGFLFGTFFLLKNTMAVSIDLIETWRNNYNFSKGLLLSSVIQWFTGNYLIIVVAPHL